MSISHLKVGQDDGEAVIVDSYPLSSLSTSADHDPTRPPSGLALTSRWRARLARLRAAIANPAPEDEGLYDSVLASHSQSQSHPSSASGGLNGGGGVGGGGAGRWGAGDADDAAFLAALTHNGVGASLPGQRELDAEEAVGLGFGAAGGGNYPYPSTVPAGGADGAGGEEVRWRGKVYQSSTDSVDEVVVDGSLPLRSAPPGTGAPSPEQALRTGIGAAQQLDVEETLFYPPPPRSPVPRKPPDALTAVLWWVGSLGGLVGWVARTVWPAVLRFFDLSFWSREQEESYRRDWWYTSKQLAFTASLFYVLNTILAISLIPRPLNLYNKITYFGIAPVVTIPVCAMVLFNAPKFRWAQRLQRVYQPVLLVATWCWSWFSIWDMWACGYYETPDHPACGNKDFLSTFYFATALPVLALFALGQHRFWAAFGAVSYFVLMCILILPDRSSWVRTLAPGLRGGSGRQWTAADGPLADVVNFIVFQAFLIYVHYMRETAERRIFILREQLKAQFKVTEKAQDLERRASDSKKRFVSYIFHEVRVPLNTALLAVQNLAPDILSWRGKDDIEFGALEGSLNMMSKVLNDVLDFNRMDSGRFESISSPFCFHNVIRTMLIPLELAAQARGLTVTTLLDKRIDDEANRAASEETGLSLPLPGDCEGWVLGDEMRLRQLVTNLTSNACKFTASGGKVCVRTSLVKRWEGPRKSEDDSAGGKRSSADTEMSGDGADSGASAASPWKWKGRPAGQDSIVVRIEVEDTGVGIRPRDIMANQLFSQTVADGNASPYVQTEIGRYQGGKGTGLGLALVRHIVKLSGGRLGVRSKHGRGSTFWVEIALGVGKEAVVPLMERQELEDAGMMSPSMLFNDSDNRNGSSAVFTVPSNVSGMRIPLPQTGVIDARAVEGATPSTTGSKSGLLDTPLSDDSAMKTILEHDGMVELTSRRVVSSPSTIRSGEPSPNMSEAFSGQSFAPLLPQVSRSDGEAVPNTSPRKPNFPASLPTPHDSPSEPPLGNPTRSPPQPSPPAEDPLPVLVVDDDHLTRRLMARMLTRLGCVADVAEDGAIALNMLLGPNAAARTLRADPFYAGHAIPTPPAEEPNEEIVDEHKYGVVFLDNQMPFYSGVQVVYKLRELGKHTFVVGVTGNALAEDQQEYLDAGVDRVLTKPVLEKDLRAMVTLARSIRKKKAAIAASQTPPSQSSTTLKSSPTIRA
ncbi:hypothetical protein CALCODRAFT_507897 [Calocera cornea HHB12733]|uniref:histidine kinase n=1 Tax=Calocera cornea HHB12733 TaxID=1353952 RepID=A0A165H179_9BASI|nr:hypothetical protein CALCODRAFT_507897 [Calocera cornea HHB12733]